ncbi:hypothetical protein ACFLV7_16180 [Chloroflexota bacterium]
MTSYALKQLETLNDHQLETQSVKGAILLALLLVGTRLFVLRIGNPTEFSNNELGSNTRDAKR